MTGNCLLGLVRSNDDRVSQSRKKRKACVRFPCPRPVPLELTQVGFGCVPLLGHATGRGHVMIYWCQVERSWSNCPFPDISGRSLEGYQRSSVDV